MSDSQKFRDRKFVAVLYPEDPTHAAAIERLKSGGYNFAGILHDKDVYEDGDHQGETKKPHWHIVLRYKNAVWNTAIAKELGIEPNYLEACGNVDAALLYLVHFGNEEKFQYEYESVFGPLKVRLATLLAEPDEGSRVLSIVDIVDNAPGPLGYSEVIKKAVAAGIEKIPQGQTAEPVPLRQLLHSGVLHFNVPEFVGNPLFLQPFSGLLAGAAFGIAKKFQHFSAPFGLFFRFIGKLGEQTVVISQKGFERLKFLEAYPVDKSVYYPKFVDRDSTARDTYRKEIKRSRSYRDDIFVMDILREEMANDDPCIQRILFD